MTTPFVDIVEDDINKAKALLAEAEKLFDEDEFENYALVIEKSSQALNLWCVISSNIVIETCIG